MDASDGEYRGKRAFDVAMALLALLVSAPVLAIALAAVWLEDRTDPFYVSERIGRGGVPFRFLKIRTMVPRAASSGVDTTVRGDPRITRTGRWIRALKVDELPQFLHVLSGRMSMVGPRPNVPREVVLYTDVERGLLRMRPGITDFASVVFADLAQALAHSPDPNIAYNQLVRPWKSRLGLYYGSHASLGIDLLIIFYTVSVIVARQWTLTRVARLLERGGADPELSRFVTRTEPLRPTPPPGATEVVTSRSVQ